MEKSQLAWSTSLSMSVSLCLVIIYHVTLSLEHQRNLVEIFTGRLLIDTGRSGHHPHVSYSSCVIHGSNPCLIHRHDSTPSFQLDRIYLLTHRVVCYGQACKSYVFSRSVPVAHRKLIERTSLGGFVISSSFTQPRDFISCFVASQMWMYNWYGFLVRLV